MGSLQGARHRARAAQPKGQQAGEDWPLGWLAFGGGDSLGLCQAPVRCCPPLSTKHPPLCLPHPSSYFFLWRCLATWPSPSPSAAPTALGLFLPLWIPSPLWFQTCTVNSFVSFLVGCLSLL